jgi:hypothetical protein
MKDMSQVPDDVQREYPIGIEKCLCGDAVCRKYGLSVGTFYNGAGFDQETAQFIADAINEKVQRLVNEK